MKFPLQHLGYGEIFLRQEPYFIVILLTHHLRPWHFITLNVPLKQQQHSKYILTTALPHSVLIQFRIRHNAYYCRRQLRI